MNGRPVFPDASGEFSVDYRNHNGNITLGQGDWTFVTHWSTAGSGSIHAYRDGGSQVAVAQRVSSIEQVTEAIFSQANFTSRTRTPRVGEVVLWLNPKGFAAAVEIKKVTVTAESDPGTVLEARYKILADGKKDFSNVASSDTDKLKQVIDESTAAFENLVDLGIDETSASEIGIGHNRPPNDFILKKDDFAPVTTELKNLSKNPTSETSLKKSNEVVGAALRKIAAVITRRLQLVEEGFFRQIGATSTIALIGWLTYTGKLEKVWQAIQIVGASVFSW